MSKQITQQITTIQKTNKKTFKKSNSTTHILQTNKIHTTPHHQFKQFKKKPTKKNFNQNHKTKSTPGQENLGGGNWWSVTNPRSWVRWRRSKTQSESTEPPLFLLNSPLFGGRWRRSLFSSMLFFLFSLFLSSSFFSFASFVLFSCEPTRGGGGGATSRKSLLTWGCTNHCGWVGLHFIINFKKKNSNLDHRKNGRKTTKHDVRDVNDDCRIKKQKPRRYIPQKFNNTVFPSNLLLYSFPLATSTPTTTTLSFYFPSVSDPSNPFHRRPFHPITSSFPLLLHFIHNLSPPPSFSTPNNATTLTGRRSMAVPGPQLAIVFVFFLNFFFFIFFRHCC